MMRRLIIAALLCSMVLSGAMAADNSIGQVIAIDGAAKAIGVDGKERVLSLKSEIFMNDRIVSSIGAKLQIRFSDDTVISQGETSEMTIDQYIYNPQDQKNVNCSVKMMKGVFRTITGKITELNPERFKVKTTLATIGIRGCELGFRLQGNREDVYVINLPRGHSIVIEKIVADEAAKGGVIGAADRIMKVINDGVAVTISASAGLVERPMSPAESGQLIRESTPSKSADKAEGSIPVTGAQMKEKSDSIVALIEEVEKSLAKPSSEKTSTKTQTQEFTQPTEAPYVPPPDTPPPVLVGGAPFTSWEWGIWQSGTVQYKANSAFGFSFLSSSEYQAVIAGAPPSRILNGSGDAGAVVSANGYNNTLTGVGGVMFQVEVGSSATPAWGGIFALSGGSDTLHFEVPLASGIGMIDGNGVMSLSTRPPVYTLVANGTTYAQPSLTAQSVNGNLIKANPASPDVNGAAGSFNFQHGPGVTVNGAFGADF